MTKRKAKRSSTEAQREQLAEQIDLSIEQWISEGLVIDSGWEHQPLIRTPLPTGDGVTFDPIRVERVLKFFRLLRQTTGRWAGQEFILLDWQVRWLIAPAFGIVGRDGLRMIRTVWFEIPRKNGKSTLASGLALYLTLADREPGAQVFAAAGSTEQAKLVFNPARLMALGSQTIRKRLGTKGILKSIIEHPITGAFFRAVSSRDDLSHGLNVHAAVIDEVHIHKTPDLIDALETGTGARDQPLILFITTADAGNEGSIYATKREKLDLLVARTATDDSWWGVVFGADKTAKGFDPFSDETLKAANPGYGITVTTRYLRSAADNARDLPSELNRYLRLHLNVRTAQETRWISLVHWDTTAGIVTPADWQGVTAWGGLDLSATTDLTAFVFLARRPPGWMVWPLFWLPEDRIDDLEQRTGAPLRRWHTEGYLKATEGNVVDYAKVRADIKTEARKLGCHLDSIAADRWNAIETILALQADGLNTEPYGQGYASMSGPSKEFERLVLGSTTTAPLLLHGGHPVLRWCADSVAVRTDDAGNIKPVKPDRQKSGKRVDGIVATIMALGLAMAAGGGSVYDELDDDDFVVSA